MTQMQVIIIQISLIILIIPTILSGQQLTKDKKVGKEIILGIKTGVTFSKLTNGSEYVSNPLNADPMRYEVTYENFKPGFSIGLFLELLKSKHFAIQPEINYLLTRHTIKYTALFGLDQYLDINYADYQLTYSTIQFCILPKYIIGKNSNFQFTAGPYFSIPFSSQCQGEILNGHYQYITGTGTYTLDTIYSNDEIHSILRKHFGIMLGMGLDIPLKLNTLGIEIRIGRDFTDATSSPNMKETSINFSLLYKWKIKEKYTDKITHTFEFDKTLDEKKYTGNESTFGIKAGTYFSKFEGSPTEYFPLSVNYEDKYRVGPYLGIFVEILKSKHFALQPEINYSFIKHDIKYSLNRNPHGMSNRTYDNADYELSYSTFQFCLVPKLILGKNLNVQFFTGPYFNIPFACKRDGQIETSYSRLSPWGYQTTYSYIYDSEIENILQKGFGAVLGIGFDLPLKTNIIGIDARMGKGFSNITSSPAMKETSLAINLIYKWRFKQEK